MVTYRMNRIAEMRLNTQDLVETLMPAEVDRKGDEGNLLGVAKMRLVPHEDIDPRRSVRASGGLDPYAGARSR